MRQVHEYAATPIVPDDFGPEGPLQEGAPRSPHTPAAIPTVDINDFVPDIDYELQVRQAWTVMGCFPVLSKHPPDDQGARLRVALTVL